MAKHTQPALIPPQRGEVDIDGVTVYVYTGSYWWRMCDQYPADGDVYDYQTRKMLPLADGLCFRVAGLLVTRQGDKWIVTEVKT